MGSTEPRLRAHSSFLALCEQVPGGQFRSGAIAEVQSLWVQVWVEGVEFVFEFVSAGVDRWCKWSLNSRHVGRTFLISPSEQSSAGFRYLHELNVVLRVVSVRVRIFPALTKSLAPPPFPKSRNIFVPLQTTLSEELQFHILTFNDTNLQPKSCLHPCLGYRGTPPHPHARHTKRRTPPPRNLRNVLTLRQNGNMSALRFDILL